MVPTATGGTSGSSRAAELELNREPILTLDLMAEIVRVDREGSIHPLGGSFGTLGIRPSDQLRELGNLRVAGDQRVRVSIEVRELDYLQGQIRLVVEQFPNGRILKDEEMRLDISKNQELLVGVADSKQDETTLAVRVLPTVRQIEPILDYPGRLPRFGLEGILYVVNRTELRSRGGTGHAGGKPRPNDVIQAVTVDDPEYGHFTMSYQPFPGAVLAGFVDDRSIVFEWDGSQFELISTRAPIMPQGKWSLFVKRDEPTPSRSRGVAIGFSEGHISKFE